MCRAMGGERAVHELYINKSFVWFSHSGHSFYSAPWALSQVQALAVSFMEIRNVGKKGSE